MLSKKYMKMPAKLRSQEERIPNTTNGKVFLLIGELKYKHTHYKM